MTGCQTPVAQGLHPDDHPDHAEVGGNEGKIPVFPANIGNSSIFPLQSPFRRENDELNQFLAGKFP